MEIIKGNFSKKAPSDLADILRKAADDVEAGIITSAIFGFVKETEYTTHFSASPEEAVVLAALLQVHATNKLFR